MDTLQLNIKACGVTFRVTVLLYLIVSGGCSLHGNKRSWCLPNLATPLSADQLADPSLYPTSHWASTPGEQTFPSPTQFLWAAESSYASARAGDEAETAACLESYFATVQYSWPLVEAYLNHGETTPISERAWQLYHSAVAQIIELGQQTRRLDLQRGLTFGTPRGPQQIAVHVHGSVWTHQDYDRMVLVGDYAAPELSASARQPGIGVPVVVFGPETPNRRWMRPSQLFAATVLLRPVSNQGYVCWTLELHDPLHSQGPFPDTCATRMAFDLTAPLAYGINHRERDYLTNFLQPGATTANRGLFMLEPYQPGKIPVVFIHGLLSDPVTWADVANVLRAHPAIRERYQLWAFEYPTGQAFFASAARLRSQLTTIRSDLDPDHRDPALERMVLVGHSMGGLLAKLQITSSGDAIWQSVANQPLETLTLDPVQAQQLRRTAYFEPVPHVSRVIFIGTPHRGSAWANCWIGRLGNTLVEPLPQSTAEHEKLIADNPDAFTPEVQRRAPRSIEMLEPQNVLLNALYGLPISPHVPLHSIIGTGHYMPGSGASDGVVPVSSAQHPGVASEILVEARHQDLQHNPDSIAELLRILDEHATMTVHVR